MFKKLLQRIARALKRNKIAYMIIGAHAVLLYGQPRMTRDIDITLGATSEALDKMLKIIEKLKLKILVKDVRRFVNETYVLPTIDKETKITVDFIFSWTAYERNAIKRAKRVKVGKTFVNFASVEDVIIHKVVAGRERDLEDVKSILMKKTKLDENYILKNLKNFEKTLNENLLDRFKKLRD